jgi:YggT family protein
MYGIVSTLVNIVFGIIEFLLLLRFIFKFLVVNASTPFVAWIYATSASLVSPFAKILPDLKLGGFVVDFSTLVALLVYAFIGYLILRIFSYISPRHYRDDGS